jgi:hypothetical protein
MPAANLRTALAPAAIGSLIDDFERPDGRSSLDTLRLSDTDGGADRSVVIANRVPRAGGGHALLITARMALEDEPAGGVIVPLSRGSVQPVDARMFRGVSLEVRGEGRYDVTINTLNGAWRAQLDAGAEWRDVRLPFSAFEPVASGEAVSNDWRGDDLLQIGLAMRRPAGASVWAEIDDLQFY